MKQRPIAVCLMGPTAAGKTDLAVELVERLPLSIVSVDSAMVFRGMDIGTAKPEAEVLARAPHRLIDILDPAESYSAARFLEDAGREMAAISAAGRIPLLVGGTMLYFRALERGLTPLPSADPVVRTAIEQEAAALGWAALHAELARVDPESARRIHPNDPQRLQRALEVYRVAGRTLSDLWRDSAGGPPPYRLLKLIVAPTDRAWLRRRIAQRFTAMLEKGFLEEVGALYRRGDLRPDLPSMRCVGYRQAWRHLAGEWDYATMVERGITATRQFAKRQYTWLRGEEGTWLDPQQADIGADARAALARAGIG